MSVFSQQHRPKFDSAFLSKLDPFVNTHVSGAAGQGVLTKALAPAVRHVISAPPTRAGGLIIEMAGLLIAEAIHALYRANRDPVDTLVLVQPEERIPVVRFADEDSKREFLVCAQSGWFASEADRFFKGVEVSLPGNVFRHIGHNTFQSGPAGFSDALAQALRGVVVIPPEDACYVGWRSQGDRLFRVKPGLLERSSVPAPQRVRFVRLEHVDVGSGISRFGNAASLSCIPRQGKILAFFQRVSADAQGNEALARKLKWHFHAALSARNTSEDGGRTCFFFDSDCLSRLDPDADAAFLAKSRELRVSNWVDPQLFGGYARFPEPKLAPYFACFGNWITAGESASNIDVLASQMGASADRILRMGGGFTSLWLGRTPQLLARIDKGSPNKEVIAMDIEDAEKQNSREMVEMSYRRYMQELLERKAGHRLQVERGSYLLP